MTANHQGGDSMGEGAWKGKRAGEVLAAAEAHEGQGESSEGRKSTGNPIYTRMD